MGEEGPPTGGDAARTAASLRIDRGRPKAARRGGLGIWLLALAVLGLVGWFAWSFFGKASGALGGREVREGPVLRLSPDSGAERTTASGYVVARTRAAISPKYPGKLVRLLVDVGDLVKEGQLLAELDHVELDASVERGEAEVARAKADLEVSQRNVAERKAAADGARSAKEMARAALREAEVRRDDSKREAERLERLLQEQVITESERDRALAQSRMDAAQAERVASGVAAAEVEEGRAEKDVSTAVGRVESARSGLASAEASLREIRSRREDAFIRATFPGRVLRKEAEVGEVIAPATTGGGSTRGALLTLADFETLEMEVDVFERDVSLVTEGSPSRIVLDAYPRDPFPGKVRQVVPTADRQKATVQVKVAFDRPDPRVLPEMGGKVVFLAAGTKVSGEAERVLVPAAAVATRDGRKGVWLLEKEGTDRRVRFVPVETGAADGDRVVARSGLAGGERVVLDPPADLKDGERVTLAKTP
jgi:RND family efflux transporter MFP subunit